MFKNVQVRMVYAKMSVTKSNAMLVGLSNWLVLLTCQGEQTSGRVLAVQEEWLPECCNQQFNLLRVSST